MKKTIAVEVDEYEADWISAMAKDMIDCAKDAPAWKDEWKMWDSLSKRFKKAEEILNDKSN